MQGLSVASLKNFFHKLSYDVRVEGKMNIILFERNLCAVMNKKQMKYRLGLKKRKCNLKIKFRKVHQKVWFISEHH